MSDIVETKMLKIDMHCHSKGISRCSHMPFEELIDYKIKEGYNGAVLTNHCHHTYYQPHEQSAYIEALIQEYDDALRYAESKNFKLYFGIEVNLRKPNNADWLLYGITKEFLRQAPCLYALSQQELYQLCQEWGIVLINAHPFRDTCFVGEPKYMDGVEINCSPHDYSIRERAINFAQENNLILTCGTDCHFENDWFCGGLLVPNNIDDTIQLAKYLRDKYSQQCLIYE